MCSTKKVICRSKRFCCCKLNPGIYFLNVMITIQFLAFPVLLGLFVKKERLRYYLIGLLLFVKTPRLFAHWISRCK